MELEELKASWNAFDKRLAESDIINLRMVKEMIDQKTRRAFDRIYGLNVYYFVVSLLILGVVFPYVYMNTPISTTSFVIVETILVIGLYPHIKKLNLLSKFNLEGKSCHELSSLVLQYKKVCHNETYWTIAIVSIAMVAFYIAELGFNQQANYVLGTRVMLVIGLTLLTFALAYVIAQWQRRRHATQMQEIEQGLEELREFER
jgi:membrane protein implicated in regulation of membrane protease activity